ncbi:MAG TPA: 23S rRNA (guanosine(2251)-2'-O)-methyltransferase RlmB [Desulfuromonadales bacterium]|nr:23S rRNA (guanosine(2251)-2'-O)-methyltransferase RlmB [Desulfuromonadales bacterium]
MADLVYGINPVREGLQSSRRRPLELFVLRERKGSRLDELSRLAENNGVPVRVRDRQDLDRLAGHSQHQGALLRLEPFPFEDLGQLLKHWRGSNRPAFFLLLDGITDPHNLGALLRSADAAGCHGVILPKDRAAPITGVVDKSSAGALEHIPVCRVTNLARTIDELKKEGIWVYGLAGEGSAPIYQTDLTGDIALVVGSEGSGLRPNVRRHCDSLLTIPMGGHVSSLNASVAGGVAMFEVLRQREGRPPD